MIELTEEQRHALAREEESPPRVLDPASNIAYVLVRADVYERFQSLLSDDDWTPEERVRLLAESGRRAGWDAPEMDAYDNYDESRKKLCP